MKLWTTRPTKPVLLLLSLTVFVGLCFADPGVASPIADSSPFDAERLFSDDRSVLALQLAEDQFRQGNWQQARRYANQAGQSPRAQILLAALAALGGDQPAARKGLEQLEKIESDDGMLELINGILAAQDNRLQQAADLLAAALDKSHDHPVMLYYLGNIYLNQGNFEWAANYFERSLNESSRLAEAQVGLGQIFVHKGDLETAAEWFQKATINAPEVMPYHQQLIKIYEQIGNRESYGRAIQQMLYHTPGVREEFLKKGFLLLNRGLYAEAIESTDKMLEIYKDLPKALYIKSAALINQGAYGEARESLNRFLLAAWGDPLTHHYAGMCFLALGDLDNAEKNFEKAVSISPGLGRSFIPLTVIEQQRGYYHHALSGLRLARQQKESPELVAYLIGHVRLAQADMAGYTTAMKKAAAMIPGIEESHLVIQPSAMSKQEFALRRNMMAIYFFNSWYEKAVKLSEELLDENPEDCFALYFKGIAETALNRHEDAEKTMGLLEELNPALQVQKETPTGT